MELYYHSEVLRTYLALLAEDGGYGVSVLVHENVLLDIDKDLKNASNFSFFIKNSKKNIPTFLQENFKVLEQADVVLFMTLDSEFKFFSNLFSKPNFSAKKILILHTANAFLRPLQSIAWQWDWKFCLRLVKKIVLEQETKHRRTVIQNFDAFIVGSSKIKDFIINEIDLKHFPTLKSSLYALPFTFFEEKKLEKTQNQEITITITGTVEKERRDYQLVYEAFEALVPCLKEQSVRLIFLGKAISNYAKNIISLFKKLENERFSFQYYLESVPQQDFDVINQATDILIIPLVERFLYSIYYEYGGNTCISGGVGDMMQCGTVALMPSFYSLEEETKAFVTPFQDAKDLKLQLENLIMTKKYQLQSENVASSLQKYSKMALQRRLKEVFEDKI